MNKTITKWVVALVLLSASHVAGAQALIYFDCEVEDPPSFASAIGRFYDALEGARPTIFLDQWIWNGENPSTHRVIVAHPDYQAMEEFGDQMEQNPAALAVGNSIDAVSTCMNDGLSVQRGAWGNQDVQSPFFAVYTISATDSTRYAEALEELAANQAEEAVGPIFLFENRAGQHNTSHIVVVGAPTLATLNEYLDSLFASDDYADFSDEVRSIRTITSVSQAERIQVWAPGGN